MFARVLVSALNHLLAGESWARERLRGFGGQHLRLLGGPLALDLVVDHAGLFRPADATADVSPAVTVELPNDAPFRLLNGGRDSVFSAARLSGTADFAETLAFVFRNLRWDVEEDLSKLVGDIGAHRLVATGGKLLNWQRRAVGNLAANFAEYVSEESDVLVSARDVAHFATGLQSVREDLERLEKRVARL